MMNRAGKRHVVARRAVVAMTVALGLGVAAAPAVAQTTEPGSTSLCRGTALKTGNLVVLPSGLTLGSANTKENPCVTEFKQVAGVKVPLGGPLNPLAVLLGVNTGTLLQVGLLEGLSAFEPNDNGAGATSRVAFLKLNVLGLLVEVGAVESHARARLDDCVQSQYGFSDVAQMKINNKPVFAGHEPARIPLGPLGNIYLNQQVDEGSSLVQRAVFIDLPGTSLDITLGESRAGAACTTAPLPNPNT